MPGPVVITNTAAHELIGLDTSTNTNTACILHTEFLAGMGPTDLQDQANAMLDWVTDLIVANVWGSATWALTQIVSTDLSVAGGIQIITPTPGTGGSGSGAASGLCALVKLNTGLRSRSGRGRIFIGPLKATAVTGDQVSAGAITTVNSEMNNLDTDLAGLAKPTQLVVASRKLGLSHVVTSHNCELLVAYQRRRGAR